MSNTKGKSIRFFMVDGTPQGILTLEIVNWTGHVLSGPRTKIAELIQRPEMKKTGIYFLTGPDPEGSYRPCVYIGESDNVGTRLIQHNKDETKDFWERACVITSKDQNLTKAHGRYLEGRLIAIAQEAGHAKLFNGTAPKNENLPEADIADMEYFIAQMRLILPVLGLDFLREKPQVSKIQTTPTSILNSSVTFGDWPLFELESKKHNLQAQAKEVDGEFVVLQGSRARATWAGQGSEDTSYSRLHAGLYQEGRIKVDPSIGLGIFQEDAVFNSPSAASSVIYGSPSNGRTHWKVKGTNKSYRDWQNERLGAASDLDEITLENLGL